MVDDGGSDSGQVGTWVLVLLLVTAGVLAVACSCLYAKRAGPNKKRSFLVWTGKPVLKNISTASVVTSLKKVRRSITYFFSSIMSGWAR